jgi:hypothetical protein
MQALEAAKVNWSRLEAVNYLTLPYPELVSCELWVKPNITPKRNAILPLTYDCKSPAFWHAPTYLVKECTQRKSVGIGQQTFIQCFIRVRCDW